MVISAQKPKYQIIAEDIIRQGFREGELTPSELSFVSRYGVSRVTIRQAMDYLESQGIVSPIVARKRSFTRSCEDDCGEITVACIGYGYREGNGFQNIVHILLFDAISQEFQRAGIKFMKILVEPDAVDLPEIFNSTSFDAVFCMGSFDDKLLSKLSGPLFRFDYYYGQDNFYSICQNGAETAIDALKYLHGKGYRRIGLISQECIQPYPFFDEIVTGYRRGLEFLGLERPRKILTANAGALSVKESFIAHIQSLRKELPGMDALIASSSDLAVATVGILREMGLKVPEDMGIISICGTVNPELCVPAITSFENDYASLAKIAKETLLCVLGGKLTSPCVFRVKAMKLFERSSVNSVGTNIPLGGVAGKA